MKRAVTVMVMVTLAACGGDGAEWPESERVAFVDSCEQTSGGLTEMCKCLLGKVEDDYPDPEDALELTIGEMVELAEECR